MKLSVLKDELDKAIQHVSKAISNRTSIPILHGIKIDASASGLQLTASDTEISIQSFIAAEKGDIRAVELERPGSIVLPAKFFSEMVRKLPSEKVEIEVNDSFLANIRSGTIEVQLMGLDPEEFPLLPQIDANAVISIPSELLKSMIRKTVFAVSTNESTPVLTGVLWNVEDGKIRFTACDRHRLARAESNYDADADERFNNIVVSGKTLGELQKILPDQNTLVDIVVSDNQILFRQNSLLFYARLLEGTYPDVSKLIPQTFQTELVLETKLFTDAIDRAFLLSREEKTNIVRMAMREDMTVEISSSSSEIGRVTEQLTAREMVGERLKISFNSKYMLDALRVMDSESVHIGFTGAMQPIIIKPLGASDTLQLVLPYRTTH